MLLGLEMITLYKVW